jgi:hypothetical protein
VRKSWEHQSIHRAAGDGGQKQAGQADFGRRYHQPTTTEDKRPQDKQLPPTRFFGPQDVRRAAIIADRRPCLRGLHRLQLGKELLCWHLVTCLRKRKGDSVECRCLKT